jgi:peptide/nickel transport system ATP-binding protein
MIEVQHLNLAFGEGEKRNQVLYDVSTLSPARSTVW